MSESSDFDGIIDDETLEKAIEEGQKKATEWHAQNEQKLASRKRGTISPEALATDEIEDVIERARVLKRLPGGIPWADLKPMSKEDKALASIGGVAKTEPASTDENRVIAIEHLYCGKNKLSMDTFKGMPTDAAGVQIDRYYDMTSVLRAVSATGLAAQQLRTLRDIMVEVANTTQRNSLAEKFALKVPEWDGKTRLKSFGRELFKYTQTDLSDDFWQYFWLSLYNRIMTPGCLAPMAMLLIGAQGCGKSYFYSRTVKFAMSDPAASFVTRDVRDNEEAFIRAITGTSVMANCAEMAGFGTADMEKIKQFITRQEDTLNHKFMAPRNQLRQWIITMDANRYAGVQRDETGNRRYYPIFCGQLEDLDGQPNWSQAFSADIEGLYTEEVFWQIMAECREWMGKGMQAYESFTQQLVVRVEEFSESEMANYRGSLQFRMR